MGCEYNLAGVEYQPQKGEAMSNCYQVCANCGYANTTCDEAPATCDQCGKGLGKQLVSVTFTCSECGAQRTVPVKGIGVDGAMKLAESEGWEFNPILGWRAYEVQPKTYCPQCRARKVESDE